MITIHRAGERFRTDQPGITSWHSFSSGAHYDPDNLSFGPIVACDEHVVDPGAGFADHPHARVELVSWVVDGMLEHRGVGRRQLIVPGRVQYQLAGTGIEHSERNASSLEPLHFVQFWLTTDEDVPDYDVGVPPVNLTHGTFDMQRRCRSARFTAPFVHLFVAAGNFHVAGSDLRPGDSVRGAGETIEVDGDGELLVLTLDD
jgi:redox-sensitive bicupin YhaK (pirin superfamily)